MKIYNKAGSFFERPGLITNMLLAANIAGFILCYLESGQTRIPGLVLFTHGALYSGAIAHAEYWRLFAAGFLHADPIHLLLNMLCLVSWGGLLELRVKTFNFIVIYLCSLVAGNVVSVYGHPANYIGIGASGALSGLVGALLCLFILGKIDLSGQFFAGAIGLNVVLMASVPRIDWWNHLGGFTAGLISCALLDLAAKLNNVLLRCKFPEFIKLNLALALALLAMLILRLDRSGLAINDVWFSIIVAVAALVLIKLLDVLLSLPRGLAIAVIGFAVFYASMPLLFRMTAECLPNALNPNIQRFSSAGWFQTQLCLQPIWLFYVLAILLLIITIVIHRAALLRGLNDVGFVGAALQADRKRCQGI